MCLALWPCYRTPHTHTHTRLLTDINTRVPTHTHTHTHLAYICNGRPAACLFICFIQVCVRVCLGEGQAKLLIFLYTIIILLYLLFLSSLWPRIELTQTQTWTLRQSANVVGDGEGEGGVRKTGDRIGHTEHTHTHTP